MKEIQFDIKLTKKQRELYNAVHDNKGRVTVGRWSRQCGKTVIAEVLLIAQLFRPNKFSAYISPSFSQGRKVFKELVDLLTPTGYITKANASTLTIETKTKSTLQFFSMENPNAIRGYTVSGILVLDEAAFFPDVLPDGSDPWSNVIYPITKARHPSVLMISTPKGKRGMFYEFSKRANNGEKEVREISATIYDDELVSEEEIETIRKSVSPMGFREEFMVEFLDSSLTFFKGFEQCFGEFVYDSKCNQYCGIDLSSTGEDNTIMTFINEKHQVRQIEVEGSLDAKYAKIAAILDATPSLRGTYIERNGIGDVMINEIKKLTRVRIIPWQTTNDTKNDIISNLAMRIANREIMFDKEDRCLFAELSGFVVTHSKTGRLQFSGQGVHDDRVMSLAIALKCMDETSRKGERTYINVISI